MAGLARELAPAENWGRAPGVLTVTRLSVEDFLDEQAFTPAPFTHGPAVEEPSSGHVHELLLQIRQRAEASGLLRRDVPGRSTAPVTTPAVANAPAATPHAASPAAAVTSGDEEAAALPARRTVPWFNPPAGPLGTRIRAFVDWLRREVECAHVFITDNQGQPMTDRDDAESPEVIAGAVLLAEAARRALKHLPENTDGAVHLDMPGDRKLCIIDTPTSYGTFCLGMLLPEALAARAADRLRRALRRTVEGEPISSPTAPVPQVVSVLHGASGVGR